MKYDFTLEDRCPICGKTIEYNESSRDALYLDDDIVMVRTYDCHGIPFRMVCMRCDEIIAKTKGYDGEYYTEADECIYDY